jgi:hypothetical protein
MKRAGSGAEFKMVRLPVRLAARTSSRWSRTLVGLVAIAVVAAVGGLVGFPATWSLVAGAVTTCAIALGMGYSFLKGRVRASGTGLPAEAVEVSASRISCRDLVDGDAAWPTLTPFRWVLVGDTLRNRPFKRSDLQHDVAPDRVGGYVVEAAPRDRAAENNQTGCYDEPQIQFDLPEMLIGPATRVRADWVVDWLNDLQARAIGHALGADEVIDIPVWLNLESAAVPPDESATIKRRDR